MLPRLLADSGNAPNKLVNVIRLELA
jgi:hypothetical protein